MSKLFESKMLRMCVENQKLARLASYDLVRTREMLVLAVSRNDANGEWLQFVSFKIDGLATTQAYHAALARGYYRAYLAERDHSTNHETCEGLTDQ